MAIRAAALSLLLLLAAALEAQAAGRILLDSKAAKGAKAEADAKGAAATAGAKAADAKDGKAQWGSPYGGRLGGGFGGGGSPFGPTAGYMGGGRPSAFNSYGGGNPGYGGFGRPVAGAIRPVNLQSRYGRRYDRSYLNGLVPASMPRGYGSRAAGPLSPAALRYSRSFASASASAVAQNMVGFGGGADSYAVAEAIVDSAAQGRGSRISDAFANAAAMNQGATADVLAQSANAALMRGQIDPFAAAAADSFVAARRRGSIRNFGLAMADAVSQGGDYGRLAYGKALARAIAGGGDGQAAVAEATAEVFCSDNDDYASAWSSAFAVALSQDENGCLVLSKARALATANCGGGFFNSYADSDSTSKVLGFCGLFPPGMGPEFSFSNTDGGSNSWSGRK